MFLLSKLKRLPITWWTIVKKVNLFALYIYKWLIADAALSKVHSKQRDNLSMCGQFQLKSHNKDLHQQYLCHAMGFLQDT